MSDAARAPRFARVRSDDRAVADVLTRAGSASRFLPVLAVVAIAQLLDLVTFAFAVQRWGIGGEVGPLGFVYQAAGYWAVAAAKTGIIAIVMMAILFYPWRRVATAWRIGIVVGAIGVFGAATNVAAIAG